MPSKVSLTRTGDFVSYRHAFFRCPWVKRILSRDEVSLTLITTRNFAKRLV